MEYRILDDTDLGYFIVETFGVFDLDEHSAMLSELVHHSNWAKGKKVLVDHRRVSMDELEIKAIREIACIVGVIDEQYGASHCAIVVPAGSFTKASIYKLEAATKAKVKNRVYCDDEYQQAQAWISSQAV